MYEIIPNRLATHGVGDVAYPALKKEDGFLENTDWRMADVRTLKDEPQPVANYEHEIRYTRELMRYFPKVVICCGAGQSRSNAIAIAILMDIFEYDFYSAYNLVKEKVPICEIEPCHIDALKKIYNVWMP